MRITERNTASRIPAFHQTATSTRASSKERSRSRFTPSRILASGVLVSAAFLTSCASTRLDPRLEGGMRDVSTFEQYFPFEGVVNLPLAPFRYLFSGIARGDLLDTLMTPYYTLAEGLYWLQDEWLNQVTDGVSTRPQAFDYNHVLVGSPRNRNPVLPENTPNRFEQQKK